MPVPSERLLNHYSNLLNTSVNPTTQDQTSLTEANLHDHDPSEIQIEKINSVTGSHESINLSLLQSLLSPPTSPPTSVAELNWTPRNCFGNPDECNTPVVTPLPPSIQHLEEHGPKVQSNPNHVLTTMYAYTNTAYNKAKDLFNSMVSSEEPSPVPVEVDQDDDHDQVGELGMRKNPSERPQLPVTGLETCENLLDKMKINDVTEVTRQCEIESYPLPTAEEHTYDTGKYVN